MDDSIAWLYDTHESAIPAKFIVIGTVGDLTPQQKEKMNIFVQDSKEREQIGIFDIMILNNESQNYQIK